MVDNDEQGRSNYEPILSRRRVLTGLATTAGVLAGCVEEVPSHEFEATPLRLTEADRLELELAETVYDSQTVTREPDIEEIEGDVTITNRYVLYERGPAHATPVVLEGFLSGVNGTIGAGAAVVVSGDALGIDDLALPVFEDEPTIAGEHLSLVVPEGARTGDEVSLSGTILLVPGTAFPEARVTLSSQWVSRSRWMSGSQWFPGDMFLPAEWRPAVRWVPADEWIPDDPESLQVLLATHEGESDVVFDRIGQGYDDLPGRPLEEGEPFETEHTMLAIPGPDWIPHDQPRDARAVFDEGIPAPLRGATYGVGVLSTPTAALAGQSVNPVAGMGSRELLTSDQGRKLLQEADVTDADEIEWLQGPEKTARIDWETYAPVTLLGSDVDPETFVGVVRGTDGPWGVVVTLAQSAEEDVVIAAGTQTSPVGSIDVSLSTWLGEEGTNDGISTWFTGGAELTSEAIGAILPASEAEPDQNNYAEIEFNDQESDGTSVTVDRTYVEHDGFITIHTWDLITEQDGPGTIIGVSRLLEAGENGEGREYVDETVELFDPVTGISEEFEGQERLRESQPLVAVPHRDMAHSGEFDFTTDPHVDIPFTNGNRTRSDLPVEDAVNDVADVTV